MSNNTPDGTTSYPLEITKYGRYRPTLMVLDNGTSVLSPGLLLPTLSRWSYGSDLAACAG